MNNNIKIRGIRMRIIINNIMKIIHTEIEVEGITVIAGENNTGKSTVGKALYATIEALYGYDDYVQLKKKTWLESQVKILGNKLDLYCKEHTNYKRKKVGRIENLRNRYVKSILSGYEDQKLRSLLNDYRDEHLKIYNMEVTEDIRKDTLSWVSEGFDEIRSILDLEDNIVGNDKVTDVFNIVFDEDPINMSSDTASIELCMGKEQNSLKFRDVNGSRCISTKRESIIDTRAYMIDSPSILDMIDSYTVIFNRVNRGEMLRRLLNPGSRARFNRIIQNKQVEKTEEQANLDDLKRLMTEKKLNEAKNKITDVIRGTFIIDKNRIMFKESNQERPYSLRNMSTGLKSVALLERILTYGILTEKSILILDEPEINLHPEWQLAYAEVIVMLQQALKLKVVLTTHSPYFLRAIEYYSEKYQCSSICHYYSSQNYKGSSVIENVDGMTDVIFSRLASPLVRITDFDE